MISREEIIIELEKMSTEENEYLIDEYIESIKSFSDEALAEQLNEKGIKNARQVRTYIKKQLKTKSKFIKINDLMSYGITGRTLHIHVVPKDLHGMLATRKEGFAKGEIELIQAVEKVREMLITDPRFKHIDKVYAVSGIIKGSIARFFENMDFDVKTARIEKVKNDRELRKFYKKFKDSRSIGRAQIEKEKLLSEEWLKTVSQRKEILRKEFGILFEQKLQEQVETEPSEKDLKIDEATRERQDKQIENKNVRA